MGTPHDFLLFFFKKETIFVTSCLLPQKISLSKEGSSNKGKNLLGFVGHKATRKSQRLFLYVKWQKNMMVHPNGFNPIALRKAKVVYNFGLSECNRD